MLARATLQQVLPALRTSTRMYASAAARAGTEPSPRTHSSSPPQKAEGASNGPQWRAPHPDYKPHRYRPTTKHAEEHVYILTLRLSDSLHETLNRLRTKYFPPERLKVPAHLTLFHALPHSEMETIMSTAEEVAGETRPFEVTTGRAFKLGKAGVAISPNRGTDEGAHVHAQLRRRWEPFLSKQDAKGFKAHWTVMNKVDDEEKVETAFGELCEWAKQEGAAGQADGLVLWKYDHGRWKFEQDFPFAGEA